MMRGAKFLICLLLIVSVATILITPDQNDDVPGVLHHVIKFQKLMAAAVATLPGTVPVLSGKMFAPLLSSREPDTPQLLTLLCVRLC